MSLEPDEPKRACAPDQDGSPETPELETCEADTETPPPDIMRRSSTFEAFGYRDYTLFWLGAAVSNTGTWMQNYALAIVVYGFRRSETDLGIVNFLNGIPILFLALFAGAIADRVDRRKLILWSQGVLLVQAIALGWLYASGALSSRTPTTSMAWVALLSLVAGVVAALTFPAWQAILPDLVPKKTLLNAIALNAAQFQAARLVGPLAASAVLLAGFGMAEIFYVNAVSFLFVLAALWVVRPQYADQDAHHAHASAEADAESGWTRLLAGWHYARGHRVTFTLIVSTALLTIFGFPYMMLLPAIADKALGFSGDGLEHAVSYLMAANGLGAVFGALTVASLPKTVRREGLVRFGLLAMGLLLIGFALSRAMWLSLVLSALAGGALLTTNSLTNTTIQASVPSRLRGRVMALFIMAFLGLMPVSSAIFGPLGEAIGPDKAVIVGAVVLIGWALALFARPSWLTLPAEAEEAPVVPVARPPR